MSAKVYLAGPIAGLSYKGATDWRSYAKAELAKSCIQGLSPMRGKEFLKNINELTADDAGCSDVIGSARGVMTRDRWDATRCDVLLVNFLGAKRVSIGTCMEIAWADLSRIPIVCAIESLGNVHEHMMISEALGYRVPTLDEAIDLVKVMLA